MLMPRICSAAVRASSGVRKLDTACFSTFAGRHLRLDDTWSDIRRGRRSLGGCHAKRSTKRGNAGSIQDE